MYVAVDYVSAMSEEEEEQHVRLAAAGVVSYFGSGLQWRALVCTSKQIYTIKCCLQRVISVCAR